MTPPQPSLTLLKKLNKEFRRQYREACKNFRRSETENGSVIIGNGSISHIPLTIYIALNNNSSISINDTLEQYRQYLINLQVSDSIGSNKQ